MSGWLAGVKLLARFADVHATDSGGLNALHVACLNCSIDVAKYLIEELNFEVHAVCHVVSIASY